jgi:E3 ubiquitin-protein ligase SHPRH
MLECMFGELVLLVECSFRNERSIIYEIATWDDTISELREKTIDVVNNLYTHCPQDEFQIVIAQELVEKATDCHLRPQKKSKSKKKCEVCVANDHLKSYEFKLFSMSKRTANFEEMSLKGSWKPTTEELIFKCKQSQCGGVVGDLVFCSACSRRSGEKRQQRSGQRRRNPHQHNRNVEEGIQRSEKTVDASGSADLRSRRTEHVQDQVAVEGASRRGEVAEEVDAAAEESHLQFGKQIGDDPCFGRARGLSRAECVSEKFTSCQFQLEYQRTVLHNEDRQNMDHLEKNLGIRSYLETLHKQQYEGQSPDPCPICKNTLEQHWSILPCGHSYCLECIQLLIEQVGEFRSVRLLQR